MPGKTDSTTFSPSVEPDSSDLVMITTGSAPSTPVKVKSTKTTVDAQKKHKTSIKKEQTTAEKPSKKHKKTEEEKAAETLKRAAAETERAARKRRKEVQNESNRFKYTPEGKHVVSPIARDKKIKGRHIPPHKLITLSEKAYQKPDDVPLPDHVEKIITGILDTKALGKFRALVLEESAAEAENKQDIATNEISIKSHEDNIADLKRDIEELNELIELLKLKTDEDSKNRLDEKQNRLGDKKKLLNQNEESLEGPKNPDKNSPKGLRWKHKRLLEKREILRNEKIINSANKLIQAIDGLTYLSKIHYSPLDYRTEARNVQHAINRLQKITPPFPASKKFAIEKQILHDLILILDLPKEDIMKPKKNETVTFKEKDFFRFAALHLILAQEAFACIKDYFLVPTPKAGEIKTGETKESVPSEPKTGSTSSPEEIAIKEAAEAKYRNFIKDFLYTTLLKRSWFEILENSPHKLTPEQQAYKAAQIAILNSATKEKPKSMQTMSDEIEKLDVPAATADQKDFLYAEFEKYIEKNKDGFRIKADFRFSSQASVASNLKAKFSAVAETNENTPKTKTKATSTTKTGEKVKTPPVSTKPDAEKSKSLQPKVTIHTPS